MPYSKMNLFNFNKDLILLLFANHPRPLSITEAHFYYVFLKKKNLEKLEPQDLENELKKFAKDLQILLQANFLKIENINGYPCFSFNHQKSIPSLVNEKVSYLLEKTDQFLFDKLSPEEYPVLTALLIVKRRFPFLKAHELQLSIEKLFSIRVSYKAVHYLYSILEKILNIYKHSMEQDFSKRSISA